MFNRHLYLQIIFHLLLILLISGGGILLIASRRAIIPGILLLVWAAFQIQHLVTLLNRTNKRIALFFDALQDNEFQTHFPEQQADQTELLLNQAFNQINHLIDETKKESQKQEHFYKALLEHAPSGILSWDREGRILLINRTALQLLNFTSLTHVRQIGEQYAGFLPVIHCEATRKTFNIRFQTPSGPRQLAIVKSSMILREQAVTLLSLQDIREQLNEKESASWMRLTHVLTHEIMNSIAPVTSLSETLSSYFEKDGEIKSKEEITDQVIRKTVKGLTIVKKQGRSLLHFAESYRKLAFIAEPVIRTFHFYDLADNIAHLFQQDLEKGNIRLSVNTTPASLTARADEELLSQVLVNLIKNSIQSLEGYPDGTISLSAFQTEQFYIEVTDNGPGIPADLQEDIFVPFFTTKATGSGIGLSLSRQIIRNHGGDLSVKSLPHQETKFIINLPV